MPNGPSTPTRVSADVAAVAASVAPTEHRTVAEQINYWVRLGIQIERSTSIEHRRALAVIRGADQFSTLAPVERTFAHAVIDATMAERISQDRFGPAARKAGHVSVSIDDDGNIIETTPDGTRRRL